MKLNDYSVRFYYNTDCRAERIVKAFNAIQALAVACGTDEEFIMWADEKPFYIKIESL